MRIPDAFRILHNIKDGLYELSVEGGSIVLRPVEGFPQDTPEPPQPRGYP